MKKITLLTLAAVFMWACQSEKKDKVEETPTQNVEIVEEESVIDETSQTQEETYNVRGQIVSMTETEDANYTTVAVNHEAIPDFMMAMQMNFKAEKNVIEGMTADDKVSFEIVKTEEGFMMRNIEKLPADTELILKK